MPVANVGAQQVARLLREYAQRTALRGGNPYRAKAYARAADSVAALAEPLERIVAEDRLTDVPGIGNAIADIVAKLHRSGTHHPSEPGETAQGGAGAAELSSAGPVRQVPEGRL